MHLHLRAESVSVSDSHARALDDEFFLSRPAAYFASRISSLLAAARATRSSTQEDEPEFFGALGLTHTDGLLSFDGQDRSLQIAVEALSVRHQAAEALLRFMYAVAAAKPRPGDAPCTWLAIADSPPRLIEVVQKTMAALDSDEVNRPDFRSVLQARMELDEQEVFAGDA